MVGYEEFEEKINTFIIQKISVSLVTCFGSSNFRKKVKEKDIRELYDKLFDN